MANNSIINLKPIFVNSIGEYIPNLNSLFLYIFVIFQFIVIILILCYFFKLEIIFIYHQIFDKEEYNDEDKKKYNDYMYNLKKIIKAKIFCEKSGTEWKPMFGTNFEMLTLDKKPIIFKNENECLYFLNKEKKD